MCYWESVLRYITAILAAVIVIAPADASASCSAIDVDISAPVPEQRAEEFRTWLCDVATTVAGVHGRFPAPRIQVTLVAGGYGSWDGDGPVTFGRVRRSPVTSIELFADLERPIDDFYADWTAMHEFSHLLLPRIDSRQRWIGEGFASYYQNVLMARAGFYTPDLALQKLKEGLARGAGSRPDLSPNQAVRAGFGSARMKIYWSGAAIALLADVELRERSSGAESLDTVLGQLQSCCLPSQERWSGTRLFEQLDELLDEPVFMPLYRQHAETVGFPDVQSAFAREQIVRRIFAVRTSPH